MKLAITFMILNLEKLPVINKFGQAHGLAGLGI